MDAATRWLAWALFGMALILFGLNVAESATRASNSFPAFYTAAQLFREGASPTRFYDDAWFALQAHRFSPQIHDIWSPSPPTAGLLLLPLTGLSLGSARVVWTLLTVALLAWSLHAMRRELAIAGPLLPVLAAVLGASTFGGLIVTRRRRAQRGRR